MNEITNLKVKLYYALLKQDINSMNKNDVNLMYFLSKDKDIQELLYEAKRER